MKQIDLIFIIYCIVIIVLILNVDVTKSQRKYRDPKSYRKYELEDEPTTMNASEMQNEQINQMKKFKKIDPAPLITYGPYTFEGVDYHDMPQSFYDNYHDCYFEHLRCLRYSTNMHIVCAYHLWDSWQDKTNWCQVELTNCLYRMSSYKGFYGTDFHSDVLFYIGDGKNCIHTLRNGTRPDPDAVVTFMKERVPRNGVVRNYIRNGKVKNRTKLFNNAI